MMCTWFLENLATILISAALIAFAAGIVICRIKNKRKGKSSCGCGCAGCPMSDSCHPKP